MTQSQMEDSDNNSYKGRPIYSTDCLTIVSLIEQFPNHKGFIESEEFYDLIVECLTTELPDIGDIINVLDITAMKLCKYVPGLEYQLVIEDIQKDDD